MEVGAVKQAFNNEVILLKKKLNQAKIQTIHKLTRKAKQLAEKKAPEPLKEKLKRKAEAAVNEVLIIKKIKPKDIAKFIVTHKGELNSFLNKPTVDNDKVCARLLLHKALQDKYSFMRGRFSNVAIKDLFMSRLERRKIKKEEKEKQKNKKKAKNNKVVNSEGDWNVEDISGKSKLTESNHDSHEFSDGGNDDENDDDSDADNVMNDEDGDTNHNQIHSGTEEEDNSHGENSDESDEENESGENVEVAGQEESENLNSEPEISKNDKEASSLSKPTPEVESSLGKRYKQHLNTKQKQLQDSNIKPIEKIKKNAEQKQKDINKTKNFNEKIMQRKLNKDKDESVVANKIVDPFFITSSGENYMSVVEPRGPDEVKAEHKQGNRKIRRAAMFGHVPNIKPRRNNNSYSDDNRFSQNSYGNVNKGKFNNRQEFNDRRSNNDFNDRRASNNDFNDRSTSNNSFNDKRANNTFNNRRVSNNDFNDRSSFNKDFNNRKPFNNDFNDRKRFNDKSNDDKPEKLHPSWEAKKKKSGILPFEGKKIVFD